MPSHRREAPILCLVIAFGVVLGLVACGDDTQVSARGVDEAKACTQQINVDIPGGAPAEYTSESEALTGVRQKAETDLARAKKGSGGEPYSGYDEAIAAAHVEQHKNDLQLTRETGEPGSRTAIYEARTEDKVTARVILAETKDGGWNVQQDVWVVPHEVCDNLSDRKLPTTLDTTTNSSASG